MTDSFKSLNGWRGYMLPLTRKSSGSFRGLVRLALALGLTVQALSWAKNAVADEYEDRFAVGASGSTSEEAKRRLSEAPVAKRGLCDVLGEADNFEFKLWAQSKYLREVAEGLKAPAQAFGCAGSVCNKTRSTALFFMGSLQGKDIRAVRVFTKTPGSKCVDGVVGEVELTPTAPNAPASIVKGVVSARKFTNRQGEPTWALWICPEPCTFLQPQGVTGTSGQHRSASEVPTGKPDTTLELLVSIAGLRSAGVEDPSNNTAIAVVTAELERRLTAIDRDNRQAGMVTKISGIDVQYVNKDQLWSTAAAAASANYRAKVRVPASVGELKVDDIAIKCLFTEVSPCPGEAPPYFVSLNILKDPSGAVANPAVAAAPALPPRTDPAPAVAPAPPLPLPSVEILVRFSGDVGASELRDWVFNKIPTLTVRGAIDTTALRLSSQTDSPKEFRLTKRELPVGTTAGSTGSSKDVVFDLLGAKFIDVEPKVVLASTTRLVFTFSVDDLEPRYAVELSSQQRFYNRQITTLPLDLRGCKLQLTPATVPSLREFKPVFEGGAWTFRLLDNDKPVAVGAKVLSESLVQQGRFPRTLNASFVKDPSAESGRSSCPQLPRPVEVKFGTPNKSEGKIQGTVELPMLQPWVLGVFSQQEFKDDGGGQISDRVFRDGRFAFWEMAVKAIADGYRSRAQSFSTADIVFMNKGASGAVLSDAAPFTGGAMLVPPKPPMDAGQLVFSGDRYTDQFESVGLTGWTYVEEGFRDVVSKYGKLHAPTVLGSNTAFLFAYSAGDSQKVCTDLQKVQSELRSDKIRLIVFMAIAKRQGEIARRGPNQQGAVGKTALVPCPGVGNEPVSDVHLLSFPSFAEDPGARSEYARKIADVIVDALEKAKPQ